MRYFVLVAFFVVFLTPSAFALIIVEAPKNKTVAFRKQYTCTNGTWKHVVRQVRTQRGVSERYVGSKCVPSGNSSVNKSGK